MSRIVMIEQRFDALQPRERTLLSVVVGVLVVAVVFLLWIEPAQNAANAQRAEIATLAPQVESARVALSRVQEELSRDPEAARRLLLEQLRQEATSLDASLAADEAAVIPPSRMPAVLRDLMGRDARLRVVGVEVMTPEVVRWSPTPVAEPAPEVVVADAAGPPLPALYRHRVALRFEGDFAGTLDYLRAVEALPMRVRLDDLEVDAAKWPRLVITLEVETLGLGEGWIGV